MLRAEIDMKVMDRLLWLKVELVRFQTHKHGISFNQQPKITVHYW